MAIGIPVFVMLLWALPTAGMKAGPALLIATVLSVLVVEGLERLVMTTPTRRRLIPLFGVGLLIVYCIALPVYLIALEGS